VNTTGAVTDEHVGTAAVLQERPRAGGFRPDIEGLRAVAILLVVVYHAGVVWLPGGFVGVDVFFVISGFLIVSQLVREVDSSGGLGVGRFYARRVLRLLPAAAVVLAVTVVAAWWWLPATRLKSVGWDVVAANGYVLNYRLAWLGTDYRTAGGVPSPVQHFWSLGVEEQFYLVVPVLVVLCLVWGRSRRALVVVLVVVGGVSLWWSVRSTPVSPVWAYFGAPSRVWELAAGALLAVGAGAGVLAGRPAGWGVVLRCSGLGLIGFAGVSFGEATVFPGWLAGVPVLGAVLVIAGGCVSAAAEPVGSGVEGALGWSGGVLGHPVLGAIGARSYSWYLWHWPVLLIGPFVISREVGTFGKLVLVGVAFGLAALTFQMVERPMREAPGLRAYPVQAGMLGVGLTAVVVVLALLLPILPPRVSLGTDQVTALQLTGKGTARTRALAKQIKAAVKVVKLPANLTPSLKKAAGDDPAIVRNGCLISFSGTRTPRRCESYGDTSGRKTMVLFGDSHAAQWYPAMNVIAKQRKWRLAVFTKVVCSAADVKIYLDPVKGGYDECVTWRKATIARIRAIHPSVVVTTSLADRGDLIGVSGDVDDAWAKAWTTTTRKLVRAGTRVVYLNDTPSPKGDVPECLSVHPRAVQKCSQTRKLAAGSGRREMMTEAAAKAGATVVDTVPWFCTSTRCPVVVGNILVYRDGSHISTAYIRLLAPLLAERFKAGSKKR
jgi:peptidoglycan/LPS O-acetylase OafA/YrhL